MKDIEYPWGSDRYKAKRLLKSMKKRKYAVSYIIDVNLINIIVAKLCLMYYPGLYSTLHHAPRVLDHCVDSGFGAVTERMNPMIDRLGTNSCDNLN